MDIWISEVLPAVKSPGLPSYLSQNQIRLCLHHTSNFILVVTVPICAAFFFLLMEGWCLFQRNNDCNSRREKGKAWPFPGFRSEVSFGFTQHFHSYVCTYFVVLGHQSASWKSSRRFPFAPLPSPGKPASQDLKFTALPSCTRGPPWLRLCIFLTLVASHLKTLRSDWLSNSHLCLKSKIM